MALEKQGAPSLAERINFVLLQHAREQAGREASPRAE
jgi:hypothetical protein